MALKDTFNGQPWTDWPEGLRLRQRNRSTEWQKDLIEQCDLYKYQQYVFYEQWDRLKRYANRKQVRIFGDIPIFVAHDSADVWANQRLFQLDAEGQSISVAGVPPDYFSRTGQRWGNPLYSWDDHLAEDFHWWTRRFTHQLRQCDMVRIDHFRGFQACWSIPANETTAENGHWEEVPGRKLLEKLQALNSKDVDHRRRPRRHHPGRRATARRFWLAGMKILQFAFDSGPDNPYLPENHTANSVVYTGTHDNDTTLGWWRSLSKKQKDPIRDYLGNRSPEMPWDLIELAMASRANLCVIPARTSLGSTTRPASIPQAGPPGTGNGSYLVTC